MINVITRYYHMCLKNIRYAFFYNLKQPAPNFVILAPTLLVFQGSKPVNNFSPYVSYIATLLDNTLATE